MASYSDVLIKAWKQPAWEARFLSNRPLRGPQSEIITKVEKFIDSYEGGVMTIKSARQTGKNEMSAILQRRHLWRRQSSNRYECWIRTAPTYKPQIVNSKKRLREHLRLDSQNKIHYPTFDGKRLSKEEGYIWRLNNAAVEFLSSGPNANVVGATASTCLDMDEAHKIDKDKFDEDFAPFTADTNAGTLMWGVGGNSVDTLQCYIESNEENGRHDLNLCYPCEYWMEVHPPYRSHIEDRINKLGEDHPIILTQYKLESIASRGNFLNPKQKQAFFSSDHYREEKPRLNKRYEMLVDIAGGNEEFNPDDILQGFEDVATDSTAIWIYEVTDKLADNNLFPVIHIVNLIWVTGTSLHNNEDLIKDTIEYWNPQKVTIDAVGIGRQIAESMQDMFGKSIVNKYLATDTTVSEDCFDLLARLNFSSVLMFNNDDSEEWKECERQVGWTKYSAQKGKMKLMKPKANQHIDLVKALTYINQNRPVAGLQELYNVEGDYEIE